MIFLQQLECRRPSLKICYCSMWSMLVAHWTVQLQLLDRSRTAKRKLTSEWGRATTTSRRHSLLKECGKSYDGVVERRKTAWQAHNIGLPTWISKQLSNMEHEWFTSRPASYKQQLLDTLQKPPLRGYPAADRQIEKWPDLTYWWSTIDSKLEKFSLTAKDMQPPRHRAWWLKLW
jgi:hypothetical protein